MAPVVDHEALFAGLKRLKLRRIRELLESDEGVAGLEHLTDPVAVVAHLVNEEVMAREATQQEKRLRTARFPQHKTLEAFDFSAQPALNEEAVWELAKLDFIRRKENVILLGPPGVGKTHIGLALGLRAVDAGFDVRFTSAGALVDALYASLADGTFKRELKRYQQFDLLLIDELGCASRSICEPRDLRWSPPPDAPGGGSQGQSAGGTAPVGWEQS